MDVGIAHPLPFYVSTLAFNGQITGEQVLATLLAHSAELNSSGSGLIRLCRWNDSKSDECCCCD